MRNKKEAQTDEEAAFERELEDIAGEVEKLEQSLKAEQEKAEAEQAPEEEKEQKPAKKPVKEKQPEKEDSSELEKAVAAAEDFKRKWYNVSAEYDNYRKRNAQAVSRAYAEGMAEAILKLLPVADTFGYALDSASDEKTKAGIDKVIKNFKNILLSMEVEELPVNVGDVFDEQLAEAVMNLPCGEGDEPNTVKQILKKGYRHKGKVIRFAQVAVCV